MILRIIARTSPSQCILYLSSVPSLLFQVRQKGVRCGAFLNFRDGFIGEEKSERLPRRDFSKRNQLQHDLTQVDAGTLLFGIARIRREMLFRDEKVLLLLNAFRGIVFQLAFLILGVLLVIQHAYMFMKILRVWKIEVDHIGAALRINGIVMRTLYAQQIEQEENDDLTLEVASRAVEICFFQQLFRRQDPAHAENKQGHSVHRGDP